MKTYRRGCPELSSMLPQNMFTTVGSGAQTILPFGSMQKTMVSQLSLRIRIFRIAVLCKVNLRK